MALKYLVLIHIAFVLCRESPQYGTFMVPLGTGLYCTTAQSLGWLTEPNISLHTCAIACMSHGNCTGFHFLSTGMSCELVQGLCTDAVDMEQDSTVDYYDSQALCPRSWSKVSGLNATLMSSGCYPTWYITGTVNECIQRACEGDANVMAFMVLDGSCSGLICSSLSLDLTRPNQYELYIPSDGPNVTFVTVGGPA